MFFSLVSGSSGNASVIQHNNTTILIDCGISGKKTTELLKNAGIACEDIDALLITHEHIDHTAGAGVISRRFNIPIYATEKTIENMNVGVIRNENKKIITAGSDFTIGDIDIHSFRISHDAQDPVGYTLTAGNVKYSIATDTGIMTDEIFSSISDSDYIMLEANHDVDMRMHGDYPYELKRRILGDKGHLSNNTAADTVISLLEANAKGILLSHLSNHNNLPAVAYQTVAEALKKYGASPGKDIGLKVADRYEVTAF